MKQMQRKELGSLPPRDASSCLYPPEARREACSQLAPEPCEGGRLIDTLILKFWPPKLRSVCISMHVTESNRHVSVKLRY